MLCERMRSRNTLLFVDFNELADVGEDLVFEEVVEEAVGGEEE